MITWHQSHKICSGISIDNVIAYVVSDDSCVDRIYGWPDRLNFTDTFFMNANVTISDNFTVFSNIPNPNDDLDRNSNQYWFKYFDIYHFPFITYFNDWNELLVLLDTVNITYISDQMRLYNIEARKDIMKQWNSIFNEYIPHRVRNIQL